MAAGLIASLIPLLEASAAGTAAKGTMDMNKKKEVSKEILDDGLLSSKKVEKKNEKKPEDELASAIRSLSNWDKKELMLGLMLDAGLTKAQANQAIETGYIDSGILKKLSPSLKRKISRMTGDELAMQLGFGPNDDQDPKKKDKKEKAKDLRDKAEDEQRAWEKEETEFQKNDPKVKRRVDAKDAWHKANRETPSQIDTKDPQFKGNSASQKMEQGELRMKEAIKSGRGPEWEYQHVTPTSNIPMRP